MRHRLRVKLFVLGTVVVGSGLTAAAAAAALLGACSIDIDGTETTPPDAGPAADVTVPTPDASRPDATTVDAADAMLPDAASVDAADAGDADATAAPDSAFYGGPYAANNTAVFNGFESGYINVPENVVTDDFTLEAWIAAASISPTTDVYEGNQIFIADVSGGGHGDFSSFLYSPAIPTSPVLAFVSGFKNGTADSLGVTNQAIATQRWIHIAIVREKNAGLVLFYLNGQINVNTPDASTDSLDSANYFAIGGGSAGTNHNGFAGFIDEVRVWNYVRSASDIAADALLDQLSPEETSDSRLVLYFKMDDVDAGTTVHDSSGGGHNGTLMGTGTATPTFEPVAASSTR